MEQYKFYFCEAFGAWLGIVQWEGCRKLSLTTMGNRLVQVLV